MKFQGRKPLERIQRQMRALKGRHILERAWRAFFSIFYFLFSIFCARSALVFFSKSCPSL